MADGDAPAILEFLGAPADVFEVHAVGGRTEIEMQVDVDVVLARQFEDAVDLAGRTAVDIRRAADGAAAAIERLDHQLVGAGIVEQTFLREHADLQVDRPGIFLDERHHAFEPAQADAGIDFEMRAHMGGALQDRLFERAPRAGMDILRRETALGLGGLGDRFVEIALVRFDAVKDAGFVEMDMGFDEARRDQTAAEIDGFALGREARLDRGDPPAGDADVGQFVLGAYRARVPQNEIHCLPRSIFAAINHGLSLPASTISAPFSAIMIDRRVGVAADDGRHDRGVDDAQALDAAHGKALVDHRHRIVAHLAGADRMVLGLRGGANEVRKLGVRLHGARREAAPRQARA